VDEISLDEGIELSLTALHADRLALLCGAGLSMAPPSNLPKAADLAAAAKRKHDALYGATRPPLPRGIEKQAEYFFQRGELATVYLRTLIDTHAFAGLPNAGHLAIADLLLVRAIQTGVSTNVDSMIETAGNLLLGRVGSAIDRNGLATLPRDIAPLLKIHGCWVSDLDNTVWAPSQLTVEPVAGRIAGSAEWLAIHLLDRDLIVVGYFTDWDYLNAVLDQTLGQVRPARVVIIDPSDSPVLAAKAPALHALGGRAGRRFCHVRVSGAEFLQRLRRDFSRGFVRQILHGGAQVFEEFAGSPPDPAWLEPVRTDADDLWRERRDFEGCFPNQPARDRVPAAGPILGLTILQLRSRGAVPDGPWWLLDGQRVRVLRTPNQLLHSVQAAFARETPPTVAPDIIIAVGAEPSPLPSHVVRGATPPTIARGTPGRWLTRPEAVAELGL
jgi:hypothetical protein